MAGQPLSLVAAVALLEHGAFNLIRRGQDGSLVLSLDRWRCAGLIGEALRFDAVEPREGQPAPLVLPIEEIAEATWDRLPRQQVRAQVRFLLRSGDLLTFSGQIDASRLEGAP